MASQLGGALAAGRLLANSTPDEHVPQDNAKKGEKHDFELLYYRTDIDLMGDVGLKIGLRRQFGENGEGRRGDGDDGDGPRWRTPRQGRWAGQPTLEAADGA